jgi:hypothetical protein
MDATNPTPVASAATSASGEPMIPKTRRPRRTNKRSPRRR